jgi:hypothetical protein
VQRLHTKLIFSGYIIENTKFFNIFNKIKSDIDYYIIIKIDKNWSKKEGLCGKGVGDKATIIKMAILSNKYRF